MSVAITVTSLDDATAPADLDAIDAILVDARAALVRPGEHLVLSGERAADAAQDSGRALLMAREADSGAVVGFADIAFGAPGPTDLTICVIVAKRSSRFRGVGRALVSEAVRRAAELGLEGGDLFAGVHRDNPGALAFFSALGLERSHASGGILELRAPLADWPQTPQ